MLACTAALRHSHGKGSCRFCRLFIDVSGRIALEKLQSNQALARIRVCGIREHPACIRSKTALDIEVPVDITARSSNRTVYDTNCMFIQHENSGSLLCVADLLAQARLERTSRQRRVNVAARFWGTCPSPVVATTEIVACAAAMPENRSMQRTSLRDAADLPR